MPAWNTLRVSSFGIILQGWWVEVLLWILAIEHVWNLLELHMYPYDVVIYLYITHRCNLCILYYDEHMLSVYPDVFLCSVISLQHFMLVSHSLDHGPIAGRSQATSL